MGHFSGIREKKKRGHLPDGGVFGDILWIDENDEPAWISGSLFGIGPVTVTVTNGIASFTIGFVTYSWPVIGAGNVTSTGVIQVVVADGVATLTDSGSLNHSFPVFGSPGTSAGGIFVPSVSDGIASFTLGTTTYAFVVVES